jgi:pyruvate,water dikinase
MAVKPWVCDDEPSTRFPVFTRGNVGETFSEVVSPLTWSVYGPRAWDAGWRDAFCNIGLFTHDEFKPQGQCEIVGCFGGYVYINMSVTRVLAVRIPGMTVASIDRSLFGDDPTVPPYIADPRDENAARTVDVSTWLASLFTVDPMPLSEQVWADVQEHLHGPAAPQLTDTQLLERFRALTVPSRRLFERHVINTYGGNVLASIVAQTAQAVNAGELAAQAVAGIGEIESARQSFDLWDMSRLIRNSAALTAAFDLGIDGLLERLQALPQAGAFLEHWSQFIVRWGFLGPNAWEFRSPTYRSDPRMALRMLDRVRATDDAASPAARALQLRTQRDRAIADIGARLSGNPQAQSQFLGAARSVGLFMAARERSKSDCARVLDRARDYIRELGERLVAREILQRWQDVLMVADAEADRFVQEPRGFMPQIRQRAALLEELQRRQPPFVFSGEPPPLSAYKPRSSIASEQGSAGTTLTGIGVSPGRYTGRARVIHSLESDSELEPGEVIVAATTDASWGPLFMAAGAVVVETGATVSHAAIVSRELGIPAAVSVAGATQRIRDGSMITVDGNAGTVVIH